MAKRKPELDFSLQEGEKLIASFHPTRISFWWAYVIMIALIFSLWGIIFAGIGFVLVEFGMYRAKKYYVTNQRLIYKYKFLNKMTTTIRYQQITDVHYSQGIVGRLFNFGNIHINTPGTHIMELIFMGIEDPEEVQDKIVSVWQKNKK